jgi:ssDNA-binding replication factor A large subunit
VFISGVVLQNSGKQMSGHKMQDIDSESGLFQVLVAQLKPEMKRFSITFKVVSVGVPRKITSRSDSRQLLISELVVGDHTGIISLVLWNDDVDSLTLGSSYSLEGGYVSIYNDCMQLGKGREAEITPSKKVIGQVDITNDMSRPFALMPSRKQKCRSKTGKSMSGEQGREARGYCTWKGF